MNRRLKNWLISLDQFIFSTLTLGDSDPDETMSAAAYRLEQNGRWQGRAFRRLIDRVFFIDPDHCHQAYLSEARRSQLPSVYKIRACESDRI